MRTGRVEPGGNLLRGKGGRDAGGKFGKNLEQEVYTHNVPVSQLRPNQKKELDERTHLESDSHLHLERKKDRERKRRCSFGITRLTRKRSKKQLGNQGTFEIKIGRNDDAGRQHCVDPAKARKIE